jgi:hypothetical protein
VIVAPTAPPPAQVETIPPMPSGQTQIVAWQAGRWSWNGANWVWVPGSYVVAPQPTAVWTPGHWDVQAPNGGYVWVNGHWG